MTRDPAGNEKLAKVHAVLGNRALARDDPGVALVLAVAEHECGGVCVMPPGLRPGALCWSRERVDDDDQGRMSSRPCGSLFVDLVFREAGLRRCERCGLRIPASW